jgi:glyceraldehyde 3-phosphate dehydrogenase
MIPTSTGAAKAVALVLPELKGRLDGVAIRVPTPNVSCVNLTVDCARDTSIDEINAAIQAAADGPMQGILGTTDLPLVSTDFNHDPRSSIFQLDATRVLCGNMLRILTWYDNEWGFSCRMVDTAVAMGKLS